MGDEWLGDDWQRMPAEVMFLPTLCARRNLPLTPGFLPAPSRFGKGTRAAILAGDPEQAAWGSTSHSPHGARANHSGHLEVVRTE